MRQVSAYIAALVILTSTLHKASYVLVWKANQATITELYCVNKGDTEILCSGKCYLNDNLASIDDPTDDAKPVASLHFKMQPWQLSQVPSLSTLSRARPAQQPTPTHSGWWASCCDLSLPFVPPDHVA